jgi:hypothetical protein
MFLSGFVDLSPEGHLPQKTNIINASQASILQSLRQYSKKAK